MVGKYVRRVPYINPLRRSKRDTARRCNELKAFRKALGLSRRQYDRYRYLVQIKDVELSEALGIVKSDQVGRLLSFG